MNNQELADNIALFAPVDSEWLKLEDWLQEAFSSKDPKYFYASIFNLFERYPTEDGAGVFWTAVHNMEHFGGYEKDLLRFFRRHPSLMTKIMLKRLLNSGVNDISGVSIKNLIS
jgi:hypothetical protein